MGSLQSHGCQALVDPEDYENIEVNFNLLNVEIVSIESASFDADFILTMKYPDGTPWYAAEFQRPNIQAFGTNRAVVLPKSEAVNKTRKSPECRRCRVQILVFFSI